MRIDLGQKFLGRYTVVARLGAGGQGTVFKAEGSNNEPVALKVAHSQETEPRLRLEARRLKAVRSPHIPRMIEAGVDAGTGRFCLVSQLAMGIPLSRLRPTIASESIVVAVSIAKQLAAVLGTLHDAGVVVRDLQPENILLSQGTEGVFVTLVDFGLARRRSSDETRLTDAGYIAGTPGFTAPEWFEDAEPNPLADVYSMGAVLFFWFVGRPPFPERIPGAAYAMQLADHRPAFLPEPKLVEPLRAEVEQLLNNCLESEPGARPSSAMKVFEALQSIAARHGLLCGTPTTSSLPPLTRRGTTERRVPNPWILAGLTLLGVVAGFALAVWWLLD